MYADYSQVESFLNFLIEAVTIIGFGGCIAHSVLKHHLKLSKIYQEVPQSQPELQATSITKVSEIVEVPEVIAPEMVEVPEVINTPPQEAEILIAETPVVEAPIPVDITTLDIDKLRIRQARKLASMLKIKQKVNGKDQPLKWLRAQIKKGLEANPHLVSEAAEIVQKAA